MIEKNTIWNAAARSGLVLGCISIVYLMANHFLAKIGGGAGTAVAASIGSSILWIAKFALCIILMRRFIKSFAVSTGADAHEAHGYGRRVALLSALLYSGFYLAYVLYINPTIFADAVDAVAESGMMTSEQLDTLDATMSRMPAVSFFVNLVYCYVFGAVLSLIFTVGLSSNPFDEDEIQQEIETNDTDNEQ